jgi:hypothetical protein
LSWKSLTAVGVNNVKEVAIPPVVVPVVKETKFNVRLRDTNGEDYLYRVTKSMKLKRLFEGFCFKKAIASSRSFIFKFNELNLDGEGTFEFYGIVENSCIDVRVHSIINGSLSEIEKFIDDSVAPYVIKVIYEAGATVRNGVEIEESTSIRTLACNEVIEAFKKSYTSESICRYQIADGWISEKLRGSNEAKVVEVLKEKLINPLQYKIIREEGAKLRETYSLTSNDLGFCPVNTLLTISEKRCTKSTESESEWVVRVKISSSDFEDQPSRAMKFTTASERKPCFG